MAEKTITVRIGGQAFVATGQVGWNLQAGLLPYSRVFDVPNRTAQQLLQFGSSATTLEIIPESGASLRFQQIQILGNAPTANPAFKGIVLADRRVFWRRRHIRRSFNVRKRTGNFRLYQGVRQPVEITGVQPEFFYADYSLNNGKAWKAKEVLEEVLSFLNGSFRIEDNFDDIGVESLEIDDPGDQALARVLAYFPTADVYIDTDGRAVIFKKSSGKERLGKKIPLVGDSQLVALVDRSRLRPEEIDVFFVREHELRFDFQEIPSASQIDRTALSLENVLPLPDDFAEINGKQIAQGTWITIDEALSWWATQEDRRPEIPALTKQIIQQYWNSPIMEVRYVLGQGFPDQVWAKRIAAVRQHYRQTFRVNKFWRDRIRSYRANRVAIMDTVTGARAPAEVYCDYSFALTVKQQVKRYTEDREKLRLAYNVFANGSTAFTIDQQIKTLKPAPAIVTVLDNDQGILRFDLRLDNQGNIAKFSPSAILSPIPTADMKSRGNPYIMDYAELVPDFQISVILTCVPAAPNNETVYYKRTLTTLEGTDHGDTAYGPRWSTRIGPGVVTARFPWPDEANDNLIVAQSFGKANNQSEVEYKLGFLLLNEDQVEAIARATAKRIYALQSDKLEGNHVTILDAERKPIGNLTSVSHDVDILGVARTTVDFPPPFDPPDTYTYLPDSIRRQLLGQLQP